MRLALAQLNPTVGDLAGNARLIADAARAAHARGADLAVFPELCVCGYPPKDLLAAGQGDFVRACEASALEIGRQAPRGVTLVLGVPLPGRAGGVTNSLLVFRDGSIVARYDKRLLPTYDVFDEDRYFTPGDRAVVVEVPASDGPPRRVGLAICEDLWRGEDAGFASHYRHAADPVAELARAGMDLLVVPSASPFVLGKGRRHRSILERHATAHGVAVAATNQVGGNDDLIFDGHAALVMPDGSLAAAAPGFVEHTLLADVPSRGPHAPADDPLLITPDEALAFRALVLGTRDYCRKTGFRTALLGLSGGIDSALTACIACAALGPSHVLGVSLPGPYSSDHSRGDAAELARRLGMRLITMPIGGAFDASAAAANAAFAELGYSALGRTLPDLAEENLQSRLRGTLLMALSNRTGSILLTTGNKSEMAVGYATLYGDMNGGLAVLADVSKQWVYRLSRWINECPSAAGFHAPPIPASTIDKPPSAELRPNQTDQDTLPPSDVLDAILEAYIERHAAPAVVAESLHLDPALVDRVCRMIDLAEYKRNQAAVGLKLTTVAFGPGRRFPIAQRWRPSAARP